MKKLVACLLIASLLVFFVGLGFFSIQTEEESCFDVSQDESGMPPVFDGFRERWNHETRLWLKQEKKRIEEKLEKWSNSNQTGSGAMLAMLKKELRIFGERLAMGDVMRILTLEELPEGLVWEDGGEEPDIGDSRAVKGGKLTLWNSAPFPSTVREFGPGSLNYFNHSLYDSVSLGLVRLHPETGRPIPGVASAWAVSDDGKTVFYKLNSRARYSNGQSVRAKDFLLGVCLRVSDFAKDPYWINRYRENIASVTSYGDSVVAVTMPWTVPLIPYMAARDFHAASPLFYQHFDASFPQSFQWKAAPTTGGYTIASGDIHFGRSIMMSRVKNWWAKDLKFYKNSCNVDHIEHRFIREEAIAHELFRQGSIDAMTVRKPKVWEGKFESPGFLSEFIERVILKTEYPCPTYGIYLNTASPLLGSIDVRKGIFHALDMDSVLRAVFQGSFSRLHSYADGYGDLTRKSAHASYSPRKAREYFARAGFDRPGNDGVLVDSHGRRLSICLTYASLSTMMNFVCDQLKQKALACGLEIRLDGLDSSVCSRKVFEKRHEMLLWAEPGTWPFPDLYRIFHSSLARDERGRLVTHTNNLFSIADEKLDLLLMQERWAENREDLSRSLHAVQKRLDELFVWVPGWKENGVRTAFWGWVRWPESEETDFCPPVIDEPLESHLYWVDSNKKRKITNMKNSETFSPIKEKVIERARN